MPQADFVATSNGIEEDLGQLRSVVQELPPGPNQAAVRSAFTRIEEQLRGPARHPVQEVMDPCAETSELFAKTFDTVPVSISIATLREGTFVEVNQAFLRRLGYSREEVIGRTSTEIGMWGDPVGREGFLQAMRAHGTLKGFPVCTVTKAGERRYARVYTNYVRYQGEPCILAVSEALEEHIRAEEEIARLKRFYEQVLNDLPAEVAVFDVEGRYLYLTPSTLPDPEMRQWIIQKTDYDLCALLGTDVTVAYRRHAWLTQTVAGKVIGRFEETFASPTGQVRHFIRLYNPVLDGHGNVTYVISYGIDVTELKRLEEQFSHAQKMEAVGRLAGGVAHDFNNLLTAIIGTTDLILGDLEQDNPARDGLEEIRRAADRAASLTRQLLAFSRRQVVQPTVLNLNKVLSGMQTILQRLIGEHIQPVLDLDPALAPIKADATQIEQVVMNLAVNARDAMPRGGTLTVRTANVTPEQGEVPAPLALAPPPYVLLEVTDTGCGMDEEVKSHLFEPFFTTKEEGRGTGLGLSTVYAIVDRSGGHVSVESEPGKGSTFRIYFPRTTQVNIPNTPNLDLSNEVKGAETVLLVEDEDAVRNVVRRILEMNGFRVHLATDGIDALEVAAKIEQPIKLLLSDVVMPRMSGRELAERLKAERPDMHVLFMSGHTDDVTVHHVAIHQRMAFIQKPFSASSLVQKIREVLESQQE